MTPLRCGALALILLGSAVSLLAILRSRRVPTLRPVAVACGVFVALDAARWWGLPGVADVVVFCGMAGVWAGLLSGETRRSEKSTEGQKKDA